MFSIFLENRSSNSSECYFDSKHLSYISAIICGFYVLGIISVCCSKFRFYFPTILLMQVYVSLPQNPDDPSSAEWSLIVQLDEGNELEKDKCCFDVTKDHLEISLVKRQQGLWTKMFVGVSETDLKVSILML